MPKLNLSPESIPYGVEKAIKTLGRNIAYARRRRRMRHADLAAKAGITPVTLRRVERGNPTTSIAAYFTTLWVLGLEREIANIAAPDDDEEGKALERSRTPERIRLSKGKLDADF